MVCDPHHMVPRARFERATHGLGNRRSVQLSYRGDNDLRLFSQKVLTLC